VVTVGATLMLDVVAPVLQLYVAAPLAASVVPVPAQMLPVPVVLMPGAGDTVMLTNAVSLHWFASAPMTLYVLLLAGATKIPGDTRLLLHVYVLAPLAVRLVVLPAQMTLLLLMAVTVGTGATMILMLDVAGQLYMFVPSTLYVVLVKGVTVTEAVFSPVLHV
jgi:hypothetical protein